MSNQAEAMMQDQIEGAQSENEALRDAARWRETGEEDPDEGQEVLAAIWPYGNKANRLLIVHAVYVGGEWLCPAERTSLHAPGYWMPAPALPDVA